MKEPTLVVLSGGVSAEREVSLASGRAVYQALPRDYPARLCEFNQAALPEGLSGDDEVVFPVTHGTFGEDGQLQSLLEAAKIVYAGCDAACSRLCMDKQAVKELAFSNGIRIVPGMRVQAGDHPPAVRIIAACGEKVVAKPNDQGSSVGLSFLEGENAVARQLANLPAGRWLFEQCIEGRELSVGVVNGQALSVVEIIPQGGYYDYARKYTPGQTSYACPAEISPQLTAQAQQWAEALFAACGCRDFARVDYRLDGYGQLFLLEINTLPGMTETSLLPKSAAGQGWSFPQLVGAMLQPALKRFARRKASCA